MIRFANKFEKSSLIIGIAIILILTNSVLNYFIGNHIYSYSMDVKQPLLFIGFITLAAVLIRKKYNWAIILLIIGILISGLLLLFNFSIMSSNQSLHEVVLNSWVTLLLVYALVTVVRKTKLSPVENP